jgi:hypothetical protein
MRADIARFCRKEGVARAHTYALLGIFDRSSMAATIADSVAPFRYQAKPITHRPRILSSPDVGAAARPVRGVSRQKIKAGQTDYIDVDPSHVAQTADESFLGALNFAIVEAVGTT